MITLVTLPPTVGLPKISPFCAKVEMTLTSLVLEFDHETEWDRSDPFRFRFCDRGYAVRFYAL